MTNGTWTHVAGAINVATTTITMWLDGSVADTKSDSLLTNILMHSYDLHLGAKFDDTAQGSFDGYIDEVRISKIARTSDWIETTVVNQQAATPGGGGYLDPIGIECPTDWIAVPGNTTYGTTDFCGTEVPPKGFFERSARLKANPGSTSAEAKTAPPRVPGRSRPAKPSEQGMTC
jgi:hypothetical protein